MNTKEQWEVQATSFKNLDLEAALESSSNDCPYSEQAPPLIGVSPSDISFYRNSCMGNFDQICWSVVKRSDVTTAAMYARVQGYGRKSGKCWASVETLARELNISEGTARKALQRLCSKEMRLLFRIPAPGERATATYVDIGVLKVVRWVKHDEVVKAGLQNLKGGPQNL